MKIEDAIEILDKHRDSAPRLVVEAIETTIEALGHFVDALEAETARADKFQNMTKKCLQTIEDYIEGAKEQPH